MYFFPETLAPDRIKLPRPDRGLRQTTERAVVKAKGVTLTFPLWPKQARAFTSPATEQLYGGAMGGGKSHWMRVALIMWCLWIPGLQCYLFRRQYKDLWANHMEGPNSFPMLLAEAVNRGLCTITSHRIAFYNGSRIFLNHLQHSKDLTKYQGPEMHVLAFDELTHFEEHQYRFLRTRLRIPEEMKNRLPAEMRGLFPRIISGSNPGDIGHTWVKRMFIGEKMGDIEPFTIFQQGRREGGMMRQFIPARLDDNPSLDREEYEDKIAGIGDPVLVRAYLEGDWDIIAGSMFGEVWRDETFGNPKVPDGEPWHVCRPVPIPIGWPLWRGGDDGFAAPAGIYHLTRDPDKHTIYVVNEIYQAGLTGPELAERTKAADLSLRIFEPRNKMIILNPDILTGTYDSNAFADTGTAELSRGEQMNRLGCRWKPVEKWGGSRIARVQEFHRLLRPNPRERGLRPGIVFFNTCRNAIANIKTLMRDPDNIEDIKDGQADHSFDGVTYAIQHVIPLAGRATVHF